MCWLLRSDPVIFGVVALTLLVGIAYEVARDCTRGCDWWMCCAVVQWESDFCCGIARRSGHASSGILRIAPLQYLKTSNLRSA